MNACDQCGTLKQDVTAYIIDGDVVRVCKSCARSPLMAPAGFDPSSLAPDPLLSALLPA